MREEPRGYRDENDLRLIRRMLLANCVADERRAIVDFCHFLTLANGATLAALRLWEDEGGAPLAFAWSFAGFVDVVSDARRRDAEAQALAWEEARARAAGLASLSTVADEQDAWRTAMLSERGYTAGESAAYYAARRLDEPLPGAALPAGYELATMTGELSDIARRAAAQSAALPWSPIDAEGYAAVMRAPGYRRELDLHAVAPDGALAAFVTMWLDEETRVGVLEPVGCAEAHRRRGLSMALIAEGLARLRELGASRVYVGNGPVRERADEPGPPRRLYARAGFREFSRMPVWSRAL